jgi:allophanate hydrolase
MKPFPLTLAALRRAYVDGTATPELVVEAHLQRYAADHAYTAAFIHRPSPDALRARAGALGRTPGGPLWGALVAVKDNIDVAGMPTTAACPAFAYEPERSSTAVERLEAAGAIVVGKTNLDQFATGLVGTRSPYGEVPNALRPEYASGGSSSGSAVSVGRGWVHLALGTDTAGSGRVPAAFNNIVGLKPSYGRIPNSGMLPACASFDCVSIFGLTVADCWTALRAMQGADGRDAASAQAWVDREPARERPVVGMPCGAALDFGRDDTARAAWLKAIDHLDSMGVQFESVDWTAFSRAAELLYNGPFVAQRLVAAGALLERDASAIDPTVRRILEGARKWTAADAYRAERELAALKRQAARAMAGIDLLLVPSTPTFPTRAAIREAPIERNAELGRYTNFVNLLDLCALAVPAPYRDDGLPAGVTLIGRRGDDYALARLASRWHESMGRSAGLHLGGTGEPMVADAARIEAAYPPTTARVAVVGAHLSGMPLNVQLTERGGQLVWSTRTASEYRLFALPGPIARPGLVRVPEGGAAIEVEVWSLPMEHYGGFVAGIAAPLGIGIVRLADGSSVQGFLCETVGIAGCPDITHYGGWRAYMAAAGGKS